MPITTHESPIWRAKANFIVLSDVSGNGLNDSYEQIWTRQIEPTKCVVCCIPFFTYGISLGDVVLIEKHPATGNYVVKSVTKRCGRRVLRVWVDESDRESSHEKIVIALSRAACLFEISSNGVIAIDAENEDQFLKISATLDHLVDNKTVFLEHG